jgi:nucleotide-binding universal stress UspA family protein
LEGNAGSAILNEIRAGGYELTVMGAGNRSRVDRLLLGSVSTKVLHASPTSVMVVHGTKDLGDSAKVLLATDGSRPAEVAARQLVNFLEPTSCSIDVVSVAEVLMPEISFPIAREAYAASAPTPEQEEAWTAAARRYATEAASRLEASGYTSVAKARLGAPTIRLLDEAEETGADLVMLGTNGLGALERALLGSVSDQVVRHARATYVAREP